MSDRSAPRPDPAALAEPPAIADLFREHFTDVFRIVSRLLGPGASAADVEDLTQQVFLAAHRALPRFRGDSKPSTWLYGIASRVVLTNLRTWRRQRRLKAALEATAFFDVASPATPERSLADAEELRRVWRCLMRIKPKKRVVYLLHEVEGREGPEIAAMLEIPIATVWSRLHHARKELLVLLDKSAQEGSR